MDEDALRRLIVESRRKPVRARFLGRLAPATSARGWRTAI